MSASIWARLQSASLFLDQSAHPLEIERTEVEAFYEPLARRFLAQLKAPKRRLIAIAGPPGCGKSSFALILSAVINLLAEAEVCAVVGQDGWHFSNAYLETHTTRRAGHALSLRQVKGSPETFDVQGLHACLLRMREESELTFPVYSRVAHDPLPAKGLLRREHKLILIEGNYLLLRRPGWQELGPLFDTQVFITAPLESLLENLRERHRRGGKDEAAAEAHIQAVDLPNIRLVLSASSPADILIEKADARHIRRIIYPEIGG